MEARETLRSPDNTEEGQRPSHWLTGSLALLTLSACYLLGPGRASMGWVAAAMVFLHTGLGLLLVVPIGFALGRRWAGTNPVGLALLRVFSGVCALTGITLTAWAAQGHSIAHERLVWTTHLVTGFLAAALLLGWFVRRCRPALRLLSPVSLLLLGFLGLGTLGLGGAVVLPHYDGAAYYRDLTATNAAQAENPLFPAGVRLAAESGTAAASSSSCGRAGCHEAAHREWLESGHALAASDVAYRKVAAEFAAHSGQNAAQWCAGCHDPLTLMQTAKPVVTPSQSIPSPETGVGCVACHAITDVSARTGNGHFTLTLPQNYPFAEAETGWKRRMHDFLVRVRPAPHQAAYRKPAIHATAEFCGACHRQSFNVAQNGYQFVHGPDEWGTWQAGPFSGRTARTAGLTTQSSRTCQECHFRRLTSGKISHASPGANSWLPTAVGDIERANRVEQFARASHLSVNIFAFRRAVGVGQDEAWIAPLDAPTGGMTLRAGETGLLDIVVTNRNVGHEFPAGYLDIKDVWLEVTLRDGAGSVIAESGLLSRDDSPLPRQTHAYRLVPLGRDGQALIHHELTRQVTTAIRRAIPPGGSDIARYRLTLPQKFVAPLTVQARLRSRPLRPDFARFAGIDSPIAITTLAESHVALPLTLAGKRANANSGEEMAQRFAAYGVGLLAPKEAPEAARARRAFLIAQRLAPQRPEAFLGLGRAYLAEPALLAARSQFATALRLAPDSPAAQADLAVVYSKQGDYDHALRLFSPLAVRFPQDSALQFDLGLTLFRSGSYVAAAEAFQRSLAADPDNAAAHFQLKQCYQHLRRVPEARREEAIGQYLAEDRLASLLVPPYLRTHPDDRQDAQPIPEYPLRSVRSQR